MTYVLNAHGPLCVSVHTLEPWLSELVWGTVRGALQQRRELKGWQWASL